MFNLILFGPPGSGKGTQSEKIVEKFGLIHLSTGNLLRQEIADKTPLGLEARNFMDKGQLVPDEVVIGMDESISRLSGQLAKSSPEAMSMLKKTLWQGTEDWDDLLSHRAEISGRLVLSNFTREAISKFKNKVS